LYSFFNAWLCLVIDSPFCLLYYPGLNVSGPSTSFVTFLCTFS
jgi:hypothetical protein